MLLSRQGFCFTPQLDHLIFFHQVYTGRIFLYITKAKTKTKKIPKHTETYTNLCDHWAVQWSSTMVLLVYLIVSIKLNNDYILARATFRPPIPILWSPYLKWNWSETFLLLNTSNSAFHLLWNLPLYLIFSVPLLGESNLMHFLVSEMDKTVSCFTQGTSTCWTSNLLNLARQLSYVFYWHCSVQT